MLHAKSAQKRWEERLGAAPVPFARTTFPDDAVDVIYKPSRSAMTSGKLRTREWKLRFEPRRARSIEPLMGWTATEDTLSQVEVSFPSAKAAMAYAPRQGLHYVMHGLAAVGANIRQIEKQNFTGSTESPSTARPSRLEWVERPLGSEALSKGVVAAHHPCTRYAVPQDVLRDGMLSEAEKRDVLRRWALNAYLLELETSHGNRVWVPSHLDDVIDALIDVDEAELRRLGDTASAGKQNSRAA
jgi:ETC complex I subunit conserved region